jgi:hypothetical protein
MKTVEEYRQFAGDCRKLAAELADPKDRYAMELMAVAWDKVANEREASLKSRSPLETTEAISVGGCLESESLS